MSRQEGKVQTDVTGGKDGNRVDVYTLMTGGGELRKRGLEDEDQTQINGFLGVFFPESQRRRAGKGFCVESIGS